ncbi:MAG: hypothetical protein ACRDV6_03105 [Acidimicrobiales bacterium]
MGVNARIRAFTQGRMTVRFGLAATDQCVSSLSNFAVGVAVARLAGIAALGAYSLAYVLWLVVADVHRSLITDPMAIENDLHDPQAPRHVRIGLAAELSLGLAMALPFALGGAILLGTGQHAYGECLLALAPWLPVLLVQDYWRWVGFMKSRPGQALANDGVFGAVQTIAFLLLFFAGIRSSVLAVEAWGLGALAGACFGLVQHSVLPTLRGGVQRIRLRWSMSKWLVGESAATWGASQAYLILAGAMLGPAALGGLKAAQSLVSGPSLVLLQAGGSVGLPEAARALKERGWPGLRRVQRVITGAGLLSVGTIGLVVVLFGRQLLEFLYGHQFGRFGHIADVLALSVFLGTMSLGAILSLKTTRLTKFIFRRGAISLVVSVIATVVLVPFFGLAGAASAAVARAATSSIGCLTLHWRHSRRAAEQLGPDVGEATGVLFGAFPDLEASGLVATFEPIAE